MTFKKIMFVLPIFIFATLLFTSCSKDESISDTEIENYTEDAIYEMQRSARCGMRGCFEFIFPIEIVFEDLTTASVDSYEDMRATIHAWKEENPDATSRPGLSFPLEIMTEEGEIISIDSAEGLKEVVSSCKKEWKRKHNRLNNPCYMVTFPLNILSPTGDTITVESAVDLRELIKSWADVSERPHRFKIKMVFPVTVVLKEDGSEVTVESLEDLKALKEECREK